MIFIECANLSNKEVLQLIINAVAEGVKNFEKTMKPEHFVHIYDPIEVIFIKIIYNKGYLFAEDIQKLVVAQVQNLQSETTLPLSSRLNLLMVLGRSFSCNAAFGIELCKKAGSLIGTD